MSVQVGSYVPLLIVAMVTWKVANSPSTSSASTTSTSSSPHRTSSRPKSTYVNAWGSSVSERVSARNVRHSRTGSSPRNLAANTNEYARRGSRSMSPGVGGGMRMSGAGSRTAGGFPYGTRGPLEGGRR
ncbi:hypothetical protein B9Z19DRAFT_985510 [Tuber borchii]|uniref:Uncharacterized protein n=1 Tax=Tuber borchii TaxID=42251 RepID=A0A2T6ZQU8_TUBBO|nr:hypothetical protein B9Z19DRAFT_985510 [Tuber borchii]